MGVGSESRFLRESGGDRGRSERGRASRPAPSGSKRRAARRPAAPLATLALLLFALPLAAVPGESLTPERLRWSELRYIARKLIFTAETAVTAELVAAVPATAALALSGGHDPVVPAGDRLARIEIDTEAFGRHSRNTVLVEPASGAALQATSREFGKRARLKTQRFTAAGVAVVRARPEAGEEKHPVERWSRRSEEFLPFPAVAGESGAITDSVALFWLLATGPFERPGDTLRVRLMSGGHLVAVTIAVVRVTRTRVELVERRGGTSRRVAETVAALEVTVKPDHRDAASPDGDLEFLGMRGSVRILFDPVRRAPLEVSGRVPSAGTVTVRLRDVALLD